MVNLLIETMSEALPEVPLIEVLLRHNDVEIDFCVRRAIGSSGKYHRRFPVPSRHVNIFMFRHE